MARIAVDKNWTLLTTSSFVSAQCVPDNDVKGSYDGELKFGNSSPAPDDTGNLIVVGHAGTPANLASTGSNLYGRIYGGKGQGRVAFEVG